MLDSSLTGEKQLTKLNQQMAIKLKTFSQIRKFMTEKTAILVYKTTILPIIDYNDIIYGMLTENLQLKLQRLQNRALRTVFVGKKLSTSEMHEMAGIAYLKQRRYEHLMMLMFLRSMELAYHDTTHRITRQADAVILRVPMAKSTKYMRAPVYMGSTEWNKIPHHIRNIKTRLGFKMRIKKYIQGRPRV